LPRFTALPLQKCVCTPLPQPSLDRPVHHAAIRRVPRFGFSPIRGIARDSAGNLYLTESNSIRRVTPSLFVSQYAGDFSASRQFADGPAATAKFDAPVGIVAASGGVLFIADSGNSRIRRYVH
jgi:hypothetical protein